MTMRRALVAVLGAVLWPCALFGGDAAQAEIEVSKPLPPAGGALGTTGYTPTEKEAPVLKKVPKEDLAVDWDKKDYALAGRTGQYTGWFGIVRESSYDAKANSTKLLVEMRYFDGLTDLHLQVVSCYGAGDFNVVVAGKAENIPLLSLVRVYGPVAKEEKGVPEVAAEFVRVWDWGLFTFMDYGKDKTNEKWRQLRKVGGPDMYSSRPSRKFYEERLGLRTAPQK